MHIDNKSNEYADFIRKKKTNLFDRMPKSVWAAIALSLALRLCEQSFDRALFCIHNEWAVLFKNGIVPQKPIT